METARTTLADLQAAPQNRFLLALGWKIVPCSCMCGGEWAWINPDNRMHGCVCHNTPNQTSAVDQLREALAKPTGETDGSLRLENLDPVLAEVSEVDCTHLVPPLPVIDCLTECEHIGACCKSFVLWDRGMPWPETQDAIEAQAEIDKRGLPFELQAHGSTVYVDTNELTGKHVWYLTCKALMEDGLCGIYEHRPDLCNGFRPGADPLCIKHPDHQQAKARFALGMGAPVV
jgi:Fe-S-cluster containining protein